MPSGGDCAFDATRHATLIVPANAKDAAQFVVVVDVELAIDLSNMIDDGAVAQREGARDCGLRVAEDE